MPTQQRLIRLSFLLYYCLILIGAPIPVSIPSSASQTTDTLADSTERFPCEGGSCGCSAAHCWSNCCCRDQKQRLEWAKQQGVTPPKNALRAALLAGLDISPWSARAATPNDRHVAEALAVCDDSRTDAIPVKPCCSELHQNSAPVRETQAATDSDSGRSISILAAMSCRGQDVVWSMITAAPLTEAPSLPAQGYSALALLPALDCVQPDPLAPPTPPPRS